MCTELILAVIYFVTIFAVNFFLYKLLKNYFQNIFYLQKIRNICINLLKSTTNLNMKKDLIVIEDIYKNLQKFKISDNSINYSLNLFEKEYFFKKNEK